MPLTGVLQVAVIQIYGPILREPNAQWPAFKNFGVMLPLPPYCLHVLYQYVACCFFFVFYHSTSAKLYTKLDGQGRARREAARRRKSEWKVNLGIRNSTRSNGSW